MYWVTFLADFFPISNTIMAIWRFLQYSFDIRCISDNFRFYFVLKKNTKYLRRSWCSVRPLENLTRVIKFQLLVWKLATNLFLIEKISILYFFNSYSFFLFSFPPRGRSVSSDHDQNSESEHTERSPLVSAKLDSLAKLLFSRSLMAEGSGGLIGGGGGSGSGGTSTKDNDSPTRFLFTPTHSLALLLSLLLYRSVSFSPLSNLKLINQFI